MEAPMDSLVADTWEKLGPAPDVELIAVKAIARLVSGTAFFLR